ncbi:Zn-binding Pro-Ala-Ala-Arg (PAAR) domain-containing protein, incolved in TypeVI secretion [Lentzea fradiae]|uniref:Zn-binding Pro-Ala-Ala-Arg (PAAR) domain-containing protein, incolved in TypeVI secretion n=1 Tax=Lentzea fradiae TaxID=200378 RepID=A0A1G8CRK2_9PSEU|nr:PAAR domain-containing protein [Lentzea fradiae]SDH48052.1 Zn-binding Pro-Ala-Ala-Arg (PAAR) domain-containing protein, incolved in TypeVI secretion [Lentzea fradiae]
MPPAARQGDKTLHSGTIGPPLNALAASRLMTVLIEGKPAATINCVHVCTVVPHNAAPNLILISPAIARRGVLIGGLAAATVGDETTCKAKLAPRPGTVHIGGPL